MGTIRSDNTRGKIVRFDRKYILIYDVINDNWCLLAELNILFLETMPDIRIVCCGECDNIYF